MTRYHRSSRPSWIEADEDYDDPPNPAAEAELKAAVVAEINAERRLTGSYGTYDVGERYTKADDPINDGAAS